MTDEEEVKKLLEGFDKSFFQKLACTMWQLLLGVLAFSAGLAWVNDTFVESDGPFAMYFAAGIVIVAGIDMILRIMIKREKREITK